MSDGTFNDGDLVRFRVHLKDEWETGVVATPDAREHAPPDWTLVRIGSPRRRRVWFRTDSLEPATSDGQASTESNLVAHARRELALLGETDDWYVNSIVGAVRAFAAGSQHGGGSATVAIDLLTRLLRREALTPLTDHVAEWRDVSEQTGSPNWWQNVRDSRAISHDGGHTYWRVDNVIPRWPRRKRKMYRSRPSLRADGDG